MPILSLLFGRMNMAGRRFHFADQEPDPPPRGFWIKRLLVTGLIAGGATYAHIYFGLGLKWF